ncbi:MAG: (d)CMP kinase [Gammaproteobacteria bacterium]|nr:(d)CMP kinase [Gammaproteobacteria bacterium]
MTRRVERLPVVTLDGPSGTGKGTLGLRLAAQLGWHFLDSGALYRVVGLLAKRRGVDLNDGAALSRLAATLPVEFQTGASDTEIVVEGAVVTAAVRDEAAGEAASQVAAWPAVRTALVQRQHAFRRPPGLIADGRDMGTVIFPDAELKIFLTASPEIRAERRYKQLREKGFDVNLAQLLEDIRNRDERDFRRAVAPLKPAPDAEILDTTQLGIAEVEARVLRLMRTRGLA